MTAFMLKDRMLERYWLWRLKSWREFEDLHRAAKGLAAIGSPRAIEALVNMLVNLEHQRYEPLEAALVKVGPSAVPEIVRTLKTHISAFSQDDNLLPYTAREVLMRIGQESGSAEAVTLPLLGADEQVLRRMGIEIIEELAPSGTEALPALTRLLSDSEYEIRVAAAAALSKFGGRAIESVPALYEATKEENADALQAHASMALEAIGDKAVDFILEELKNTQDLQRCIHALTVLAHIGPNARRAIPALMELSTSKNRDLKNLAAGTLNRIRAE